ncbi:hypothetical protein K438DRAFT_1807381 [Mycena galopus ATCC 62051]|nr:hypothetical protein K438DRAFT_1807381 [Mycena galopus ATCC 62051]
MVAPIGKLPMELLVEIFRIVMDEWGFGAANTPQKVFCLSQISSYWRQIVQKTPALWAKIELVIKPDREPTEPYLDGLKTILARSDPYSISVTLIESRETPPNRLGTIKSWGGLADIIFPTAARWKDLRVELNCFLHLDALPPGTFEALESLSIEHFREQTSPITMFQFSPPRLKSFVLQAWASSRIRLFHLPWGQLTHLNIRDDSIGGCRAVLLQCSNLVRAKFDTSSEWDLTPEEVDSPIVVLSSLKTLDVDFHASDFGPVDGLEAFLMPLSLPSLTKFVSNSVMMAPTSAGRWRGFPYSKVARRKSSISA